MNNNISVFLGGTCNNSTWREALMPHLECDYFNPVVEDWTEEAQQIEIEKRNTCDFVLYVITPKMTGVYSIAELIESSINEPHRTIFCTIYKDDENEFTEHQLKSLKMVKQMVIKYNVRTFDNLIDIANFLNFINRPT